MEKRGEFPAGSAKKDVPEAGVSLFLRRRASLCVLCRAVFACSCSASVPPKGGRRKTSFGTGRFFAAYAASPGKIGGLPSGGTASARRRCFLFLRCCTLAAGCAVRHFFRLFCGGGEKRSRMRRLKKKGRRNIRRPGAPRRRGVGREITSRYRTFHRKRRTRGTCRRTCPC